MGGKRWVLSLGHTAFLSTWRLKEPRTERRKKARPCSKEQCLCLGDEGVGRGFLPFSLEWSRKGTDKSLVCRDLNQFPLKFSKTSLSQKTIMTCQL